MLVGDNNVIVIVINIIIMFINGPIKHESNFPLGIMIRGKSPHVHSM